MLAAARKPTRGDTVAIDDLDDLEFLGLWGILDPPRPEAIEAIADCHTAGIRVKMIWATTPARRSRSAARWGSWRQPTTARRC